MKKVVIYIHGKGGNVQEAEHYRNLFVGCDVVGFDYKSQTPWEANKEFSDFFDNISLKYDSVQIVANSIGAYFSIGALQNKKIDKAFFISPIVNMEKLILDMMDWAGVSKEQLRNQKEIETSFNETLSLEYLCFVEKQKIKWKVPTHILYGEKDNLTSIETISEFAKKTRATITILKGGEHWFHTKEQMDFLDKWIEQYSKV